MFDSSQANASYYNTILDHMGLPALTPAQFEFAHMHTADEVIAYLVGEGEAYERAQHFRQSMTYDHFIQEMQMEPDLTGLLEWLRPAYKTAIATNRTTTMHKVVGMFGLETCFDQVVTASDVERPKPDPQMLNKIVREFGLTSRQMLYIGDSQLDALAAQAADVVFAAFRNRNLLAHEHIETLTEIKALLKKNDPS